MLCLSFKLEANHRHAWMLNTMTTWASILFVAGVVASCFGAFFWIVDIPNSSSLSDQSDMRLELGNVKIEFESPTSIVAVRHLPSLSHQHHQLLSSLAIEMLILVSHNY